jgi:small subunit ribosomal protein S6
MKKYQLLYIIDNDATDEVKEATVNKFSALIETLGGTISEVEKWGTKAYAFLINKKKEGYYVLVNFEANPDSLDEIERQMRINENIVRQMITLHE